MKILVLLDGSIFAESVLEPASKLAARSEGKFEVHLAQIASIQNGGGPMAHGPPLIVSDTSAGLGQPKAVVDSQSDNGKDYLEDVACRFFPGVPKKIVEFGEFPAAEIIGYARREKVDMIAIASYGKTGLARMLLFNGVAPLFMVSPYSPTDSTTGHKPPAFVELRGQSDSGERAA